MSFSTVFQLYQDDERVIMNGCVKWFRKMDGYLTVHTTKVPIILN